MGVVVNGEARGYHFIVIDLQSVFEPAETKSRVKTAYFPHPVWKKTPETKSRHVRSLFFGPNALSAIGGL
jgi:hypothetical protein